MPPRGTRHERRASGGRLDLLDLAEEMIERAGDVADRIGGNLRVTRRGVELGVSEKHLDDANIDVLLQEMRRKAVPQRVRRYPFIDPSRPRGGMAGAGELTRGERLHRITAPAHPSPGSA